MSKDKLKISDLPPLEEIMQRQLKRQVALAQNEPDPAEVVKGRMSMVFSFLFQNFNLMEKKDKYLMKSTARQVAQYGFLSIISPIYLNIKLGKIAFGRIFDLPKSWRFGIRTTIYAVPLLLHWKYTSDVYNHITYYLADKYMERVQLFMKFNDPKIMNPYIEIEENEENEDSDAL
ncbi:hypothetical protein SteCoe_8882 [Stentor coeruleus]|uniref:Uncharacterized protein n=1 Tax=Stentor coeruleus TaxID=5963 RepID=A0A1R2CJC9_9CILI|nr:hypothetical protein SteCoe_8882 [Stentor coeruleus]